MFTLRHRAVGSVGKLGSHPSRAIPFIRHKKTESTPQNGSTEDDWIDFGVEMAPVEPPVPKSQTVRKKRKQQQHRERGSIVRGSRDDITGPPEGIGFPEMPSPDRVMFESYMESARNSQTDTASINEGILLVKGQASDFVQESTDHLRYVDLVLRSWLQNTILPAEEELDRRNATMEHLRAIFPREDWCISTFGSAGNGLSTKGSDIDIQLYPNHLSSELVFGDVAKLSGQSLREVNRQALSEAKFILQGTERRRYKDMEWIPRARVPLLKFVDRETNVACDVSGYGPTGLQNTELLRAYVDLNPMYRDMVHIVKHWARQAGLLGGRYAFNSFGLSLMVLQYLQAGVKPQMMPSLHAVEAVGKPSAWWSETSQDEWDKKAKRSRRLGFRDTTNECNYASMLTGFFHYYSQFPYADHMISVRAGQPVAMSTSGIPAILRRCYPFGVGLHCEDPVDGNYNVTRIVSRLLESEVSRKLEQSRKACLAGQHLDLLALGSKGLLSKHINVSPMKYARDKYGKTWREYKAESLARKRAANEATPNHPSQDLHHKKMGKKFASRNVKRNRGVRFKSTKNGLFML
eukprot:Clim_evm14s195 gene=Clim_evmTU14s195